MRAEIITIVKKTIENSTIFNDADNQSKNATWEIMMVFHQWLMDEALKISPKNPEQTKAFELAEKLKFE